MWDALTKDGSLLELSLMKTVDDDTNKCPGLYLSSERNEKSSKEAR